MGAIWGGGVLFFDPPLPVFKLFGATGGVNNKVIKAFICFCASFCFVFIAFMHPFHTKTVFKTNFYAFSAKQRTKL